MVEMFVGMFAAGIAMSVVFLLTDNYKSPEKDKSVPGMTLE